MSAFTTITKRVFTYASVALLGITILSSCKKDDEYDVGETAAQVSLINASTNAGDSRLYVDGTLRTPTNVAYGNASGYYGTFVGNQTVEVKSASGDATLTSSSTQLDALGYYSFVLVGQNNSLGLVTVSDPGTAPASGKARVRFVNAVTNANTASLSNGSSTVADQVSYRAVSAPAEVNAGSYTFTAVSGNSRSAATTATLEAGKVYVVYAKGLIGGTGNTAFSVGVSGN
jgi:hypothetical protein